MQFTATTWQACSVLWLFLGTSLGIVAQEPNLWTNTASGKWEDPNWSLGILPGDAQTVRVTSPRGVTVEIDDRTTREYGESLLMGHLIVSNSNTLFLNHAGRTTPLHLASGTNVWNGLEISGEGKLINLDSDVLIDNLLRVSLGGAIFQNGGKIRAPNTTYIHDAQYHLTNGLFEAGWLELPSNGRFNQSGGQVNSRILRLLYSQYFLAGGELNISEGLSVSESAIFIQDGGTNRAPNLSVSFYTGDGGSYILNAGLLCTSNLSVTAFRSDAEFIQNGGVHIVTNEIQLAGSARYYPPVITPGRYILGSNGVLRARSILLKNMYGGSSFQTSGSANISEAIQFAGQPDYIGNLTISGGVLACSNLLNSGTVVDIRQTGGALIVSNFFSFSGYYPGVFGGRGARRARYDFAGGTLNAENIELAAEWVIGSSERPGRITNSGSFHLAGILRMQEGEEHLGPFALQTDALIDLSGRRSKLSFAKGTESWTGLLTVTNWNGAADGGGEEQLKFGDNETGLATAELSQIRFANPEGFPPGGYMARILSTGEVVPSINGIIVGRDEQGRLVLKWPASVSLQVSTNVAGPYADVSGAKPPYYCEVKGSPQMFFRLGQ